MRPIGSKNTAVLCSHSGGFITRRIYVVCLIALMLTVTVGAQSGYGDSDKDILERPNRSNPIDQMIEFFNKYSKPALYVGLGAIGLLILRWLNPLNIVDSINERSLKKAIRGIDPLLKHIAQYAEAENADNEDNEETEFLDGGILASMTEIADLVETEDVPPYVLTVNNLMLDNIQVALKHLKHFKSYSADKHTNALFIVLDGIKTITEQIATTGAASSLAVDARDYFSDDKRFHAWKNTLDKYTKKGEYAEQAQSFLVFIKTLKQGNPISTPKPENGLSDTAVMPALRDGPDVPELLNEDTLPLIQKAAAKEARVLSETIQSEKPMDVDGTWQCELVQRQEQLRQRIDAQKMLMIFLKRQVLVLQKITQNRMLPCRTWEHMLYMLGVTTTDQLQGRVQNKLLTQQEIMILAKAFLQTFAKRPMLARIYGSTKEAGLVIDLHIPQIKRNTLLMLRSIHQADTKPFAQAIRALDKQETPANHEVIKLVRHYVQDGHTPKGIEL